MIDQILDKLKPLLPDLNITGQLKVGGQKVVFSCYYKGKHKSVFKIVKCQSTGDRARVIREINILSSLNSKFFPSLYQHGNYDFGTDNVFYVVEEFIEGQNLRDYLNSLRPSKIELTEAKRIISSLLDALLLIEPLHLIHRDIKPENIIISPEHVVLIDFGIARDTSQSSLTDTYAIFGPMTPGYAPPEQIRNEKRKISFRTDLFSVAVVFYEILTGQNPFILGASSVNEVLGRTMSFIPKSLTAWGYNKSFDKFIFSCIEKSCHRRPSSLAIAKSLFENIIWEV